MGAGCRGVAGAITTVWELQGCGTAVFTSGTANDLAPTVEIPIGIGAHVFRLTATDDLSAIGFDEMTVRAYPGTVVYVDADAAGTGEGGDWTNAAKTIVDGITVAQTYGVGEIWVADGAYPVALDLPSDLALYGGFVGTESDLSERPADPDPFTIARDKAPVVFEPGSRSGYSNPGMAMLAYAVTAAIQAGPHKDIRTLLAERIMKPIGLRDQQWSIGYKSTYEVDGLPLVANWGGGSLTPRAAARVGRLMLRRGDWQGGYEGAARRGADQG